MSNKLFSKEPLQASEVLENVVETKKSRDELLLGEIKDALNERGFGLLLLFFSVPLAVPVPVPPGVTTIASIPLLLLSVQIILGRKTPWLPLWLMRKKIRRRTLAKILEKSTPSLRRIEKILRPRLVFISGNERFVGFMCFILACNTAIPVPFGNILSAAGISIISLGFLSRDGFVITLGYILGFVGILLSVALFLLGGNVIDHFFGNNSLYN
jgi:hypothetical protein